MMVNMRLIQISINEISTQVASLKKRCQKLCFAATLYVFTFSLAVDELRTPFSLL